MSPQSVLRRICIYRIGDAFPRAAFTALKGPTGNCWRVVTIEMMEWE